MVLSEKFKLSAGGKYLGWNRSKIVFLIIFCFNVSNLFAVPPQTGFQFEINPLIGMSYQNQEEKEKKIILEKLQISERKRLIKLLNNQKSLEEFLKKESKENIQVLFQIAISSSSLDKIRYILENSSVDINAKNNIEVPFFHLILMRQNQDIDITRFFLNYSGMDLHAVNKWGDNLFHAVFLSAKRSKWLPNLNLLFDHKQFKDIAHLLNTTNIYGETPMDFFIRELMSGNTRVSMQYLYSIYQALKSKGARYTVKSEDVEKKIQIFILQKKPKSAHQNTSSCRGAWI